MLTAILLSAALQTGQPANLANTLPIPNNGEERWPGTSASDYRWTLNAPLGLAPFLVATGSKGQIAVRWASTGAQGGSYYVAVRQTPERLEQADSRECEFGAVVQGVKELPVPEIIVPGLASAGPVAPTPMHGSFARVTIFGSRQPSGEGADLTIAAASGPANAWIEQLFSATQSCWKPMAPPDPA